MHGYVLPVIKKQHKQENCSKVIAISDNVCDAGADSVFTSSSIR